MNCTKNSHDKATRQKLLTFEPASNVYTFKGAPNLGVIGT